MIEGGVEGNLLRHMDQFKGVRPVFVGFSVATHTVGAFPTAPGHALTETSAINHLLCQTNQ